VSASDEAQTLERAKAGDRKAFDALHTELQSSVWRFVDRLLGPTVLTPDIVQRAFLALYLNIERIASTEHLRPFLYRVARNLCYDELRWRGRFEHASLDTAKGVEPWPDTFVPDLVDPSDLPDEAAHLAVLWREVRRAMERLPELQRQALILYAEEDLTYEQVAEAMGSDLGTVKSRIHNGRKNLMKHLKPELVKELGIDHVDRL